MTENEKSPLPPGLYEKITEYISARFRLGKLGIIEKSSQISVSIIIGMIIGFFVLMAIFLFGFGLAEFISFKNGDIYSGFFWVGAIFIILLTLIFLFKKSLSRFIQNKLIHFLSKIMLDDEGI